MTLLVAIAIPFQLFYGKMTVVAQPDDMIDHRVTALTEALSIFRYNVDTYKVPRRLRSGTLQWTNRDHV
jgi:hypothetical protein